MGCDAGIIKANVMVAIGVQGNILKNKGERWYTLWHKLNVKLLVIEHS